MGNTVKATVLLLLFLPYTANAEWRIMQRIPAGETARIGDTIPVPLDGAIPENWAIDDGTEYACSDVPDLCAIEPNHVINGNWSAKMTGVRVLPENSRSQKWMTKIK